MTRSTRSFRSSDENYKSLSDLHGSVSSGAEKAVEAYLNIRPEVLNKLEEIFTKSEMEQLAALLKNSAWDPSFAISTTILEAKIKKAGSGNTGQIIKKINSLSPTECYFLQEEIFHRNNDN